MKTPLEAEVTMNQPNSPVISTRAPAVTEGPDFLSVLRRYAWLLIGGAVACAAVSGGLVFLFLQVRLAALEMRTFRFA